MLYPVSMQRLSYDLNALEPYITAQTMTFHYGKHYASYVDNLNRVLADQSQLHQQSLEQLVAEPQKLDARIRQQVINFGGGVYNHELFWQILGPDKDQIPTGNLAHALVRDFGSFEQFKEQLSATALGWFGSGWGWLCVDKTKKLVVLGIGNQDCPLSRGLYPLINIDVWEHAYYLQYQNRRAEFIAACWHVINWRLVENRYELFS